MAQLWDAQGGTDRLRARCEWLRLNGFRTIISLERAGANETADIWVKLGRRSDRDFAWYESFLYDFNAPCARQLSAFVRKVEDRQRMGAVAVHCGGGTGRTGCFLAAYLMRANNGWNAARAVREVRRRYNTNAVELMTQYNALARFGDILRPTVRSGPFDGADPIRFDLRLDQSGIQFDPGHNGDAFSRTAHGSVLTSKGGKPVRHALAPNRPLIAVSVREAVVSNPPFCTRNPDAVPRGRR